jgi:branched-chain amino acid transport system substrate-binding protein
MALKHRLGAAALVCALSFAPATYAADTVKVGILAPFSGALSMYGKQFREAIEVYQKHNGTRAGAVEIEFVYRDLEGPNPTRAKTLARELIVKDKVQYIGGVVFTPNAMAIAPLAEETKVPFVVFNAATSAILDKSAYVLRASYTLSQVTYPLADYAVEKGVRTAVTMVADYAPGHDGETAFKARFEAAGGKVLETIRMPIATTDFAPFMQRAKALAPQGVYVFLPAGPPTFGFTKAFAENGLKAAGIRFLGTAETEESNLQALGDAAIGLETAFHYSSAHASPANDAFKKVLTELHPGSEPNFASVGAYDGAQMIYRMVAATGGKADGDKAIAAVKGQAWESPRGPIQVDAKSRDIVQNVYMRVVERDARGRLINKEFRTFAMQPDYGRGN